MQINVSSNYKKLSRSPLHNAKVNGHPQSLHLVINSLWAIGGTCAVDVAATDGQYRAKLITLALDQEWSVGVASSFVHLDQRSASAGCRRSFTTMGDNP